MNKTKHDLGILLLFFTPLLLLGIGELVLLYGSFLITGLAMGLFFAFVYISIDLIINN